MKLQKKVIVQYIHSIFIYISIYQNMNSQKKIIYNLITIFIELFDEIKLVLNFDYHQQLVNTYLS